MTELSIEVTQLTVFLQSWSFTLRLIQHQFIYLLSNKYIQNIRNITYFGKAQPLNLKAYTPENIKIILNIPFNSESTYEAKQYLYN